MSPLPTSSPSPLILPSEKPLKEQGSNSLEATPTQLTASRVQALKNVMLAVTSHQQEHALVLSGMSPTCFICRGLSHTAIEMLALLSFATLTETSQLELGPELLNSLSQAVSKPELGSESEDIWMIIPMLLMTTFESYEVSRSLSLPEGQISLPQHEATRLKLVKDLTTLSLSVASMLSAIFPTSEWRASIESTL